VKDKRAKENMRMMEGGDGERRRKGEKE